MEFEQILNEVAILRKKIKAYSENMELSLAAPCNACHKLLEMDSYGFNDNHICEVKENN